MFIPRCINRAFDNHLSVDHLMPQLGGGMDCIVRWNLSQLQFYDSSDTEGLTCHRCTCRKCGAFLRACSNSAGKCCKSKKPEIKSFLWSWAEEQQTKQETWDLFILCCLALYTNPSSLFRFWAYYGLGRNMELQDKGSSQQLQWKSKSNFQSFRTSGVKLLTILGALRDEHSRSDPSNFQLSHFFLKLVLIVLGVNYFTTQVLCGMQLRGCRELFQIKPALLREAIRTLAPQPSFVSPLVISPRCYTTLPVCLNSSPMLLFPQRAFKRTVCMFCQF